MKNDWRDTVIAKIDMAVYVPPNTGKHIHKDRPNHGLVLNDGTCVRDYCFSDGRVLRVGENALFYLPKGSSYEVKTIHEGGCYAINFDAGIADIPFSVRLKNSAPIKKSFKRACDEWLRLDGMQSIAAMRALYEAIDTLLREREQEYMPNARHLLIIPAIAEIERSFLQAEISVEKLSALCGISEVYFRKIFASVLGVSPKEYIIRKRMEHACRLLLSGQCEVNEVAALCGYAEPCHFSREFKKRMGVSPKGYL